MGMGCLIIEIKYHIKGFSPCEVGGGVCVVLCYVVVLYTTRKKVTGNSSLQEKKSMYVLRAAPAIKVTTKLQMFISNQANLLLSCSRHRKVFFFLLKRGNHKLQEKKSFFLLSSVQCLITADFNKKKYLAKISPILWGPSTFTVWWWDLGTFTSEEQGLMMQVEYTGLYWSTGPYWYKLGYTRLYWPILVVY